MNHLGTNLPDLALRHWRSLAFSSLAVVVFAGAIIADDIWHDAVLPWAFPYAVLPCFFAGAFTAARLRNREHLPWGTFYGLWLVPPMVIWLVFIFVRGAVFTVLGRPL